MESSGRLLWEVVVENGGKSLRRMEGSLLWRTCGVPLLVFQTRVGGDWGVRVLKEERAKNWSPKYVWQGAFATSAHSDPPLSPQFANVRYELFKLGHFPGSVYAVAFTSSPSACTNSGLRVHGYGGSPPTQRGL